VSEPQPERHDHYGPDPDAVEAAIDAVEAAARALARVCDPGELLVEWVLVSAVHRDHGDGATSTGYRINGPTHETAAHHVVGLLTTAIGLVPAPRVP
jgi:hypothetical protein